MKYPAACLFYTVFVVFLFDFTAIEYLKAEEKTITLATEEWKDATNKDGTGLYWDILRAVYEPEGYKIKPIIRSYQGAVALVENESVDGMIGAYKDEIQLGLYPEKYFAVDIVQALYMKNSGIDWRGINTIKGKRIGWVEGYAFNKYLPDSVMYSTTIRRVDTRKVAINLIKLSKIDFFLDAEGDLKDFFIDNEDYRIEAFVMKTLIELKLYICFANNENGKLLVQLFDQNFSGLLKAGGIRKLYEDYSDSNFTIPSSF